MAFQSAPSEADVLRAVIAELRCERDLIIAKHASRKARLVAKLNEAREVAKALRKDAAFRDAAFRLARHARENAQQARADLAAARAGIEYLREAHDECAAMLARAVNDRDAAAADERADVVAFLRDACGCPAMASAIESGAHVGAAKGAT